DGSDESLLDFQRAVQADPYFSAPRFRLRNLLLQRGKVAEADAAIEDWDAWHNSNWFNPLDPRYYTDLGPHALVIARPEFVKTPVLSPMPLFERDASFHVQLAPGARWATTADLLAGPVGQLRAKLRERFGGIIVVLDYNHDEQPDLFLLGAVVEKGRV